MYFTHIGQDQPAEYEIRIQGRLNHTVSPDSGLADWFQGEVRYRIESSEQGDPLTVLCGTIMDQSALHGLLNRIRDLGLVLLVVDCLSAHKADKHDSTQNE